MLAIAMLLQTGRSVFHSLIAARRALHHDGAGVVIEINAEDLLDPTRA
jgi:hypothetical protein